MEKELLKQALDSILHGSTQIISRTDSYGGVTYDEVRINDLRVPLVNKIAEKLAQTPEFKAVLEKAVTPELIKQLQQSILSNTKFSDLPYDLKRKIENDMNKAGVEVRKYKVVAEVVEEA